nr:MAG TPA: Putative head tail adaptor [Caudoviricetes sp.]
MKRISDDRYKGELQELVEYIDENDRPKEDWLTKRVLFFSELGISANEQLISLQEKSEISRKIGIRYEPLLLIDRSNYHIKIEGNSYNIQRVYTDMPNERMELSLAYVK